MANIKFFFDNKWNDQTLLESSQHANFPSENTQLRDFNHPWRTLYGAGSGWGIFRIYLNGSDKIDFDEGGGEIVATLTAGVYTADSVASHIGTIMTTRSAAVGNTWTYVCSYSETTNKFTIEETSGPNNFTISWLNGTNGSGGTGYTVGDTIGFDESANDNGGAASFEADDIRIHFPYENIYFLTGSTISVYGVIIRGHNIQAGATVSLLGSDDDFSSAPLNDAFTVQNDIMILEYDATQAYQDWQIRIYDEDNPDTYVEVGVIFLGAQFQPTINYLSKSRVTKKVDPSIVKRSEAGQISTIQLDDYEVWQYTFRVVGSFDKGHFDRMFLTAKKSLPLFICEDPDSPLTTTYYCQFVDWEWTPVYEVNDVWDLTIQVEELA